MVIKWAGQVVIYCLSFSMFFCFRTYFTSIIIIIKRHYAIFKFIDYCERNLISVKKTSANEIITLVIIVKCTISRLVVKYSTESSLVKLFWNVILQRNGGVVRGNKKPD